MDMRRAVARRRAIACGVRHNPATRCEKNSRWGTSMKFIKSAGIAAAIVSASLPAFAQTPEQFYKGKQIELAIGYPPAGSNDVYARLLARHIGRHIPGNPTVVPQNRPGAGSFLTLGYVYNVAPKDGTVIGIGAPTAPLDEKVGAQGVRFKSAEL